MFLVIVVPYLLLGHLVLHHGEFHSGVLQVTQSHYTVPMAGAVCVVRYRNRLLANLPFLTRL